jgi:hypothetical protein
MTQNMLHGVGAQIEQFTQERAGEPLAAHFA